MVNIVGGAQKRLNTIAVYDALPKNASVFNQRLTSSASTVNTGAVQSNVQIGDMTVPAGYVFILRKFNVDLVTLTGVTGVPNVGATYSISSPNNVNFFTQSIWVDPLTGDIDTWYIAEPEQQVIITASYDYSTVPGFIAPFDVTFQPWFKGHMIPVDNIAHQLVYLTGNIK